MIKIINISIKKIVIYYLILLSVLLSGSVYFSLLYVKQTRMIFFVSTFLIFIILVVQNKIKIDKNKFFKLIVVNILVSISFLINSHYGLEKNNLFFILCMLISVYFMSEIIEKDKFQIYFVNVMKYISILSLVIYFITLYFDKNIIPFYREQLLGTFNFKFTFFYSWGWGLDDFRNAGLFWEPGMFQCYINLAILFLLFGENKLFKHRNSLFLIFTTTLITTQSTTGYITFAVIIIYSIITGKIKIKGYIKKVFIYLFSLLIIFYFLNNDIVVDKFSEDNGSYIARTKDFDESKNMIVEHPFLGIGYSSEKQNIEQESRGITRNSNGLLIFIIQFGIIGFLIYSLFLYKGIKNIFGINRIDTMFILIIICTFYFTEPLLMYPIWLFLLFGSSLKKEEI